MASRAGYLYHSAGYTYTITMTFNDAIIDLDMYVLAPDFVGDEEDILAWSEEYTSPEVMKFTPDTTSNYYLLILAYLEEDDDILNPTEYFLEIVKGQKENTGFISFPIIVVPIALLAVIILFKKLRR